MTGEAKIDWWSEMTTEPSETDAPPVTSPEPAGMWDSFRSGMIEDPRVRHSVYAAQRFPDMPERDRLALYGEINGRTVYRDPSDGRLYYELGGKERVAKWLGENALPIAGGMIGAAAVPTGGVAAAVGAPGLAALGAAGGMGYRKVGGELQGDNQDALDNVGDMATEAAWNAAGTAAGQAIGKHIVGRRAARDLSRFNADDAARLAKLAEARGILITPAEATKLGSLVQQQSALGQGMDEAADTLRQFYGNRTEAMLAAIDDFIGTTPGPAETGRMASRASGEIIDDAVRARSEAARPLYESVVRPDNVVPTIEGTMQGPRATAIGELLDDPFFAGQVKAIKGNPLYRMGDLDDASLPVLDMVKRRLDDAIETAARAGERNKVRLLEQRRVALLKATDAAFPDYPAARDAFAGRSPAVDALRESALGIVEKLQGTQLEKAASVLISTRADPTRVSWARAQFTNAGRGAEWDTIASQFLRDVLENTRGSVAAGDAAVAQKFRTAVFGSQRARDVMRAALGPERFGALDELMQVVEAVGRVPRQQSITHFAGEAAKREARQASPVTTFLRNLKISDPGGEILDALTDRSVERWRARMAQIITSPDAMEELRHMRVLSQLSPAAESRLRAGGVIVANALRVPTEGVLDVRETRPPPRRAQQ